MHKVKTFLALSFISITAFSQSNFVDGYIIKSNNDTVFGQIDNRSYYDNSQVCKFKEKNETITEFQPNQLLGYRFTNGKFYVSKNINGQALFMEFLINGKLSIYFYQDADSKNHYYASKDSSLSELKYGQTIVPENDRVIAKEDRTYIGVLNYYTTDCPEVKAEVSNFSKPTHKQLIRLAKKYNDKTCGDGQCIIYQKDLPKKIILTCSSGYLYSSLLNNIDLISNKAASKGYLYSPLFDEKEPYLTPYPLLTFGANILMQQASVSEKFYAGIGFYYYKSFENNLTDFSIPFSFNYLNPRKGISPTFAYEINLTQFLLQNFNVGIKYQLSKCSIGLNAKLNTLNIITPIGTGLEFTFAYDLR